MDGTGRELRSVSGENRRSSVCLVWCQKLLRNLITFQCVHVACWTYLHLRLAGEVWKTATPLPSACAAGSAIRPRWRLKSRMLDVRNLHALSKRKESLADVGRMLSGCYLPTSGTCKVEGAHGHCKRFGLNRHRSTYTTYRSLSALCYANPEKLC